MVVRFERGFLRFRDESNLFKFIITLEEILVIFIYLFTFLFVVGLVMAFMQVITDGHGKLPLYSVVSFGLIFVIAIIMMALLSVEKWVVLKEIQERKPIVLEDKEFVYDPSELTREINEKYLSGEQIVCKTCREVTAKINYTYM